ncbi:MAG TPA: hypothetical protein VK524_11430 [Polyangiaceae bacterium]|nr:hypothetical protein [Polyangiaceae bacterium]
MSLAAVLGSVTLHASDVRAQTDEERSGARAAATQGAEAYNEKRYSEAVDLFSRAESLVHSPLHLMYMARSLEKLGKLVRARELYLKVTREQIPANAPPAFSRAQADAQTELSALEPRLPYITVQVEGAGAAPVTVLMDGIKVPPALVGLPRPVDPGDHKIIAQAEGLQSNEASVKVDEGKREIVTLTLQPAGSAAAPTAAAEAPPETMPGAAPIGVDTNMSTGGSNGLKIGGFVALGVGVVGLGAGTFFLLQKSSKQSDADDLCTLPGGGCPASAREEIEQLDDDAKSAGTLSAVGFIVGGVGVATGVTLLILSGKSSAPEQARLEHKPGVRPWVGLGSAGVQGRF